MLGKLILMKQQWVFVTGIFRVREIQALHDEYNKHKEATKRDIDSLKHKNILLEQELRQAQISLKNAESLLGINNSLVGIKMFH